jgi:PAS domain S-box-containing protein
MTLVSDVVMQKDQQEMVTFEIGKCNDLYAHLDPIIFEVVKQQHVLPISNLARSKWVNLPAGIPRPGALLAVAIQYENTYYGALWVSFQEPHNFSESDTRFLILLAGQAALAAANARLYAAAEIGRQRLEAVIASAPEPVLVIDEHGFVLLLNSAALQASGLISSAEPGQKVEEVVTSQELLDLINAPMDENIQSREIFLPNGKIFSASVSRVMAKNIYVGKICILRDITHYKELDALKTEFVSTVSHDLRSPLTLVKGYASMLKMVGGLNEQQVSYAEKIGAGIDNMNRLVTNLLDLGRIDAGMALSVEAVDPMEIVKKVVEDLTPQAIQKRIQLADEQTGNMPGLIEVDKALIQQALQNLVENAIKYTNIGGEVKILVEAHPETVVFAVHDTGIGVAPLDLPRVFEKFYRSGRREAYQNRGSGLGLSIVKSVAERHGGKVWVESQLGKGSTFSMEIPIHAPVETRETNLGEK